MAHAQGRVSGRQQAVPVWGNPFAVSRQFIISYLTE